MIYPPCLNCCSRCEGCHDICDAFQDYRAEIERVRNQIAIENQYLGHVSDAVKRMKGERV